MTGADYKNYQKHVTWENNILIENQYQQWKEFCKEPDRKWTNLAGLTISATTT